MRATLKSPVQNKCLIYQKVLHFIWNRIKWNLTFFSITQPSIRCFKFRLSSNPTFYSFSKHYVIETYFLASFANKPTVNHFFYSFKILNAGTVVLSSNLLFSSYAHAPVKLTTCVSPIPMTKQCSFECRTYQAHFYGLCILGEWKPPYSSTRECKVSWTFQRIYFKILNTVNPQINSRIV